ncbi:hypothetical protein BCR34DRAFT_588335 [Clohesyomyces aquaticus]|uniref:Uncharacterized protein n=1 Tax=Clohesyomyces aquaticus TaxID=1231657 RepID=A0A1Y1ZLS0_9PLEO|nr:hypothetical protein BCR34DRAFT_588335 [Clohesyomyces aquaticus]
MVMVTAYLVVLIVDNKDEPTVTVHFAVIGYLVTVLGMTLVIWTVAQSTKLRSVKVPPVKLAAAFIVGHLSAFTVTIGFVVMYLGFRQLRWWMVLICAGFTALSTLIRTMLRVAARLNQSSWEPLSKNSPFCGFGFSPIKISGTTAEDEWDQHSVEPLQDWSVYGPFASDIEQSFITGYYNEPAAILISLTHRWNKEINGDLRVVTCLACQIALKISTSYLQLVRRLEKASNCITGIRSSLRLSKLVV